MNSDLIDLLQCLNDKKVRYLVVGAHAVAHHSEPRFTDDFDVWVEPSARNAARVWAALTAFGAPLEGVSMADFSNPQMVYQMGVTPNRIDIIMGISAVEFESAWRNRSEAQLGGVRIHMLGRAELECNKRASGRPQDMLDLERLRRARKIRTKRRKK